MIDETSSMGSGMGTPPVGGASAGSAAGPGAGAPAGGSGGGWTATGSYGQPQPGVGGNYSAPPPPPGYSQAGYGQPDLPRPVLAGILGLIPGVGAMYNGQFAKGVVHLIIFAVLVSLTDNASGLFGIFVAGWVAYQAFEAYHTAVARQQGLPLPNAFGFNDIGERFGFGKNWPGSAGRGPVVAPVVPVSGPGAAQGAWAGPVPPPPPPGVFQGAPGYVDPAGYAAPAGYTAPAGYGGAAAYGGAPGAAPYASVPYSPTFTGGPLPGEPIGPVSGSRFPVGALWLIGLGMLFLLHNWIPEFHINGSWVLAIGLFAAAGYSFAKRAGYAGGVPFRGNPVCTLRGPVMLSVLAVMFLLQAVHALTIGQTWPVLLVALGALLLLERTAGATPLATPLSSVVPPADADVKGDR